MHPRTTLPLLLLALPLALNAQAAPAHLASPDGRVTLDAALNATGALTYSVTYNGAVIIAPSPVGLTLAGSPLLNHLQILSVDPSRGADTYNPVVGKTSHVDDPYTQLLVHTAETSAPGRKLDILFRAYNSGAAFRLVLPPQPGLDSVRITAESTRFAFPSDYTCTGLNLGQYENSHEGEFDDVPAHLIRTHDLYDAPLVCRTGKGGTTLALTESDLENYAGAYLSGIRDGSLGVEINLTPRKDTPDIAVSTPMTPSGVRTPWRVILLADRPEKLIEANLVNDLAAPSRIADTSWIQPGLSTWDWWSGPLLPGHTGSTKTDDVYKTFIDFSSRLGLPYMMIDAGWSQTSAGIAERPGSNILESIPAVHLPELVVYAREKHVGLWLWLYWTSADAQMEPALTLYEQLGIRGIKVDFIDREDQYAVDFYHRLLSSAARHHIMVDLHGAFTPRGLDRTYPNFITQEGVQGAEYNKWSARETASHNVRLAYTRGLLGPMDYTPGGFRNVRPADFQIRNAGPEVMTTRAQQIAMYVVYTSPFACLSDTPTAYQAADGSLLPGVDFLEHVPTTWDETRAVAGDFGKYIAVARRKGRDWYVGVLNDETARTISLPMEFLTEPGTWRVDRWEDGSSPTELKTLSGEARGRPAPIKLNLASGGGAVLVFHAQ